MTRTATTVVDVFLARRGGRVWTYRVPAGGGGLRPGTLVCVPFGRQQRLGVVASPPRPATADDPPAAKLRALAGVDGGGMLPPDLWQALDWLSRYYMAPLPQVLDAVLGLSGWTFRWEEHLSGAVYKMPELYGGGVDSDPRNADDRSVSTKSLPRFTLRGRTRKQGPRAYRPTGAGEPRLRNEAARTAWARLTERGRLAADELADLYRDPAAVLRRWRDQGAVAEAPATAAGAIAPADPPPAIELMPEQAAAAEAIVADLARRSEPDPDPAAPTTSPPPLHLLEGITGSGKTEVYIAAARAALAAGRSVLMLTPEIALAGPLARRVAAGLHVPVALWHSAMAAGDKGAMVESLARGEVRVVVGARSAAFAPLSDLGLVVVDEEHDGGYVQGEGVAFHGRDAAIQRARFAGAVTVLGSATPSLEVAHRARSGSLAWHRLTVRAKSAARPAIELVQQDDPANTGPLPWLSKPLHDALTETLERGEQAVLFRNRRGFHPSLLDRNTRETLPCPHCDTDLSLHSRPVHVRCHICGYRRSWEEVVADHGGKEGELKPIGSGTQRIAHELERLFPNATVDRLDRDRVTSAGRVESILDRLGRGETDILVGTQMVTKGMDVERITLVGIINLDGALHMPEFRAGERVFQQICQVAGRAGRGAHPGRVLLQTHHPDHPLIRAALAQDYDAFYRTEIAARKRMGYPPVGRLVRVLWSGPDRDRVEAAARDAVGAAARQTNAGADERLRVLGPAPAPLERVRGRWRVHALALAPELVPLRRWALAVREHSARAAARNRDLNCMIQVEPAGLL